MFKTKEKKERALGAKLFLKPYRCSSAKCVTVRRPTKPGIHGRERRRRALSEYGQQLNEKQKFQYSYGLREHQMRRIFGEALRSREVTGDMIMSLLERRLDNAVFRLGFASSRSIARHLVSHGHIFVNGRKVSSSSYRVRPGDVVAIRPKSKDNSVFKDLADSLKKYEPPAWLQFDREKLEGKVISLPRDFDVPFDVNMVVDYYSKIVK